MVVVGFSFRFVLIGWVFGFSRQVFLYVSAPAVLELNFVDQAGLEVTEICLPASALYSLELKVCATTVAWKERLVSYPHQVGLSACLWGTVLIVN